MRCEVCGCCLHPDVHFGFTLLLRTALRYGVEPYPRADTRVNLARSHIVRARPRCAYLPGYRGGRRIHSRTARSPVTRRFGTRNKDWNPGPFASGRVARTLADSQHKHWRPAAAVAIGDGRTAARRRQPYSKRTCGRKSSASNIRAASSDTRRTAATPRPACGR